MTRINNIGEREGPLDEALVDEKWIHLVSHLE